LRISATETTGQLFGYEEEDKTWINSATLLTFPDQI
jgi:hypothetical protein